MLINESFVTIRMRMGRNYGNVIDFIFDIVEFYLCIARNKSEALRSCS